ncbi:MAG: hypothetical protein DRP70_10855 [Spirochaetes bacterium]|nr:MAG: hypothetical protein DRP60_03105 [Spirochaetota bacterium]RKX85988.1 MAG: hypothetical protein DRP70_10855 [Spirochaetota bacterium]
MGILSANEPFIISASVIILGYLLKRLDVLEENDGEVLAKVALNITLPSIILLNLPGVPIESSNVLLPFFGLILPGFVVLLGLFFFRRLPRTDKGLSMMSSSGYNIGLFAIPMVMGLYGSAGIARFALFDIGNAFAIFGLSWYLAWYYSPIRKKGSISIRAVFRMFFGSIPFVAYILAVVMNLIGIRLEGTLMRFIEVPAAMNRGVSLLALGILLRFKFPKGTWRAILPPLVLRYSFGIVAGALVLLLLPVSLENKITISAAMILPVGLAVIPFAVKWGYDRDSAAAILNVGIPVSFILFWLVWAAGNHLAALNS